MKKLIPKIIAFLKLIFQLLLGILFLWIKSFLRLIQMVIDRCRFQRRTSQEGQKRPCRSIPPSIYKRADPLIYDQYYLIKLGYGVTWDNPDIQLFDKGVHVLPHDLKPNEEYEIKARIWNGSNSAPAIGLPVRFSFLSFGIGTISHHIGQTTIDLPVNGAPGHPAFASIHWKTPEIAGHYCIQVELDWFDDANPDNNLGQKNVNIQPFNSPTAKFSFLLRNPVPIRSEIRLKTDDYILQPKISCSKQQIHATGVISKEEKDQRRREALSRNALPLFPVRDGWGVNISPNVVVMNPGEEQTISVEVNAPSEELAIDKTFNINAFIENTLIGGVSLRSLK